MVEILHAYNVTVTRVAAIDAVRYRRYDLTQPEYDLAAWDEPRLE